MNKVIKPAAGGRRIAALLVAALMIVAPAVWAAWSLYSASLAAEAIRSQAAMLASLNARIAEIEPADESEATDAASIFLPGETPAIAGAALQRTIADTIQAAGGRLIEAEFARVEAAEEDPGRVDLRVSFEAEIVSLQRILLDLESGLPILLVRTVDVQSATEATEEMSPPLRVAMLVGGYWEAAD